MSAAPAQLSIATAQRQAQFVLQLVKVAEFPLYVGQLFLQSSSHRRAGLQATPPEIQETSNLAEFESQTLHAADKSERLEVALAVLPEPPLCPGGAW